MSSNAPNSSIGSRQGVPIAERQESARREIAEIAALKGDVTEAHVEGLYRKVVKARLTGAQNAIQLAAVDMREGRHAEALARLKSVEKSVVPVQQQILDTTLEQYATRLIRKKTEAQKGPVRATIPAAELRAKMEDKEVRDHHKGIQDQARSIITRWNFIVPGLERMTGTGNLPANPIPREFAAVFRTLGTNAERAACVNRFFVEAQFDPDKFYEPDAVYKVTKAGSQNLRQALNGDGDKIKIVKVLRESEVVDTKSKGEFLAAGRAGTIIRLVARPTPLPLPAATSENA